MKNLLKISFLTMIIGLSSGCATIMSKSEYNVNIKSTPSGAYFEIKNRAGQIISRGKTPQKVNLKASAGYFKGEKYEITFTTPSTKKGKKTIQGKKQTFVLDTKLDAWYIGGNLALLSPLGFLIIDPITGAMFTLPESFHADLSSGSSAESTLNIISIDELTPEQRAHLKPIHL